MKIIGKNIFIKITSMVIILIFMIFQGTRAVGASEGG